MTTAACYARISLDATGQELGVSRQLEDMHALAADRGWAVAEYVDNSVSASKETTRRPAFERLLEDVTAGRVDVVVAWHTDRLARHPRQLERLIDACEAHGTPVSTITAGDLDLATPAGRAVARTLTAWARYEVDQKGLRQRRRVEQNAATGRWSGGKPGYGYRSQGGTLAVCEDEAEVVREMVSRLLAGESLRMVAADLDRRGVRPPNGARRWYPSTVRDLARSPRMAGLLVHQGKEAGRGQWAAIVTEADHRAVVRLLSSPGRRTTTTTARSRLLSGLARCAECGEPVVAARTAGGVPGYRCASRKHVSRASAPVDSYVEQVVLDRLGQPDALAALAPDDSGADDAQREVEMLTARLVDLATAFADDDVMSPTEYRAATARLHERLTRAQEVVDTAVRRVLPIALDVTDLVAAWAQLSLADRRRVVDVLLQVRLAAPGRGARRFDAGTVLLGWR